MSVNRDPMQPRRWTLSGGSKRIWLAAVFGALIVAIVVTVAALSLVLRSGGDPGSAILEMSGQGNKTSERFVARQGWSICGRHTFSEASPRSERSASARRLVRSSGGAEGSGTCA